MRWLLIALGLLEPPCPHLWEEAERIKVYGNEKGPPTSAIILLRCRACGDLKQHKVKG